MFSMEQKRHLAEIIEKLLIEMHHTEMPEEKPNFLLHVDGKEAWSWADIKPNWTFDDTHKPSINPFNEAVAKSMKQKHLTERGRSLCVRRRVRGKENRKPYRNF